jgi:geranylgeranyl pyrophosphate synthase
MRGPDAELRRELLEGPGVEESRIPDVRALFERHGILDDASEQVQRYGARATEHLRALQPSSARSMLEWLAEMLIRRDH